MDRFPYVLDCRLYMRCDFKHAEDLLAEYNDFYIYNLAHYGSTNEKKDENSVSEDSEIDEEKHRALLEHNAKVESDHFVSLFGSKDFAESTMVGFRPAWYDLQQIFLEEHKQKTPITESAMNGIIPMLRNIATVMLYAERVVSDLEKMNAEPEFLAPLKDGFELLLDRCRTEDFVLPEYHKNKTLISKFKKPEQYLEFCEKLFFVKYSGTSAALTGFTSRN